MLINLSKSNLDFYFVHSYSMICKCTDDVVSEYKMEESNIVASIQKENIFGTQFHPEKSSDNGINLLLNFVDY